MPILQTPKKYFDEDILRAKNLLLTAVNKRNIASDIRRDIFRSAWMFAVGACDAYFCDAYADLLSRTFRAKEKDKSGIIPARLSSKILTVDEHFKLSEDEGWGWRNYARKNIEKESVLSLGKVKELMNIFLGDNEKILSGGSIETWILHKECNYRLVGISSVEYRKLNDGDKHKAREKAIKHFEERFQEIFQRRHDCIHNCDRPKAVPQEINKIDVEKIIEDIEFLVNRCQEMFVKEFPFFLVNRCHFSPKTKNNVCQ